MKKDPSNMAAPAAAIDVLVHKSKFTEATAIAAQAQAAAPKDPAPLLFRGEISLAQGNKAAGLAELNQSLQRNPKYAPALFARGQLYVAQNDFAKGIVDLKQVQTLQPNNPLSFIKLAEIAALQKQPAQSIALLNQAIAAAPKVTSARVVLARYQVSLKQYKDAEATLKAALQVAPNDSQSLALLGEVQQVMGQNKDAVDTNKVLTQKYQSSGAAQALLASSLSASGDKAGTVVALKRAVDLSPDVIQYRASLIDAQIRLGDMKDSARGWSKDHKGADGPIMVAETLARLGRLPEAASVVGAAQASTPDWRLTLLASQIAMSRGDQVKAVAVLKGWLSDHATDLPVREAYANALMRAGDNASALVQYEILIKTRSDDPNILNNVAWLVKDKDPARASALASKAMLLEPNNPNIADTLGLIMIRKGDAQGALPILQRAHASSPASGDISYHLALALNATGQKADAKKILQAALGKGANFSTVSDAKQLLQKL
jgi:putative PEP-CTERM system TPR-repeat lipoprotein